jgi:hypothetical protein
MSQEYQEEAMRRMDEQRRMREEWKRQIEERKRQPTSQGRSAGGSPQPVPPRPQQQPSARPPDEWSGPYLQPSPPQEPSPRSYGQYASPSAAQPPAQQYGAPDAAPATATTDYTDAAGYAGSAAPAAPPPAAAQYGKREAAAPQPPRGSLTGVLAMVNDLRQENEQIRRDLERLNHADHTTDGRQNLPPHGQQQRGRRSGRPAHGRRSMAAPGGRGPGPRGGGADAEAGRNHHRRAPIAMGRRAEPPPHARGGGRISDSRGSSALGAAESVGYGGHGDQHSFERGGEPDRGAAAAAAAAQPLRELTPPRELTPGSDELDAELDGVSDLEILHCFYSYMEPALAHRAKLNSVIGGFKRKWGGSRRRPTGSLWRSKMYAKIAEKRSVDPRAFFLAHERGEAHLFLRITSTAGAGSRLGRRGRRQGGGGRNDDGGDSEAGGGGYDVQDWSGRGGEGGVALDAPLRSGRGGMEPAPGSQQQQPLSAGARGGQKWHHGADGEPPDRGWHGGGGGGQGHGRSKDELYAAVMGEAIQRRPSAPF